MRKIYKPTLVTERIRLLYSMLEYMRPNDSPTEVVFIKKYIEPLTGDPDDFGNYFVRIPKSDGSNSKVLWSSHTDTVHRKQGLQTLQYKDGYIYTTSGSCLGADCTVGVWLMTEMIKAKIPGLYVFHRAEEVGGVGSNHIFKHSEETGLLKDIDFAIAFDRYGIDSVITHQLGSRCCSEKFANSLIQEMARCNSVLRYQTDSCGLFTDTANYVDVIPECTNISVGYFDHHTHKEKQDAFFAIRLLDGLLKFNEDSLVKERIAGTTEYDSWGGIYDHLNNDNKEIVLRNQLDNEYDELIRIITTYPELVATTLMQYNITVEDIMD